MTPLIEKSQTLSPKKKQRPMRMEQQLLISLRKKEEESERKHELK